MKIPLELRGLLEDPESVKVLTTTDKDGVPNTVFKASLTALDDDFLAYVELFESSRSQKNMLQSLWFKKPVAMAVCKGGLAYQIKGEPYRFVIEGPLRDSFFQQVWKRIPEVNPSGVWLIRPKEIIDESYKTQQKKEQSRINYSIWFQYLGRP
ncbi:MAG TPA: hypothetical protein VJZ49_03320 [Syntrophales bacterium]|nr:hypothetical protein [Syntrophales bacterium]